MVYVGTVISDSNSDNIRFRDILAEKDILINKLLEDIDHWAYDYAKLKKQVFGDELKLINWKIIEAKQEVIKELSDTKQMNEGLTYCYKSMENKLALSEAIIIKLRGFLKEKIVHIHKKDVIHMHQKDLDNLKEYREKYKALVDIILTLYIEANRGSQYITADIYAELLLEAKNLD